MKKIRIKAPHFYCMEYYENFKKMNIDFDFRDPVYELSLDLIDKWETPFDKKDISFEKKIEILDNIYAWLVKTGCSEERIIKEYSDNI